MTRAASSEAVIPRVLHVITSLQTGGAEAMLAKLVSGADRERCEAFVVSLGSDGPMGQRVRAAGVPMFVLNASLRWSLLRDGFRLIVTVRRWRPNVLQGWMYHGNLAVLLLKLFIVRSAALLWNIRCTLSEAVDFSRATRAIIRLNALFSRIPSLIIFNSRIAITDHEARGFKPRRRLLLPNGFDLAHFAPNAHVRAEVRAHLRLGDDMVAIGIVARYHPMKDFPTFVSAMRDVIAHQAFVRIILAGPGVNASNAELGSLLQTAQLEREASLLGEISDVASLLPALDILCLPSAWGEAFPNTLGEAMSCGIVCVATNVGDTKDIIGDCGVVVPPQDPGALAEALEQLSTMSAQSRTALGMRARERVAQHYAIARIVEQYVQVYQEFANEKC